MTIICIWFQHRMNDEEFKDFLKDSLPPYIAQCFILSGYDSARVVAQMTTSGPNNSIDQIEQFILAEYPDDPSCYHMSKVRSTGIFVPGHRIKIADFIGDVKAYKTPVKRKLNSQNSKGMKKIRPQDTLESKAEECRGQRYDLQGISDCVRKRILKWVQKCDVLHYLKEHKDYLVKVKLDVSNQPVVSVFCSSCSKEYKLHKKEGTTSNDDDTSTFMISNWTNHVKKCFSDKGGKKSKKQHTLLKFLPSANANDQSSPAETYSGLNLDKNLDNPPLAKSAPIISGNSELCLDGDVDKPPLVKCALVETEITGSRLDRDLDKPSLANSVSAVTSVTVDADSAQSIGELVSDLHSLDEKKPSSRLVQPLCTTVESSFNELSCNSGTNQGFLLSSPVRVSQERI